jgi:hypothetical protein
VSERLRSAGPPQSRMWHKAGGIFSASLAVPVWRPRSRGESQRCRRKIVLETVHCVPPAQCVETWSRQQPFVGSAVRMVTPMLDVIRSSAIRTMVADRLEWCASTACSRPDAYVLAGDFNLQSAELDSELCIAARSLLRRVASVRAEDPDFAVDHVVVNGLCTRPGSCARVPTGAQSAHQLDFVRSGLSDHNALVCKIKCA